MEILDVGECVGAIRYQERTLPVRFRLNVASPSEILCEIDHIPLTERVLTDELYRGQGDRRVPLFDLTGHSETDQVVTLRHVFVKSEKVKTDRDDSGIVLTCAVGEAEVRQQADLPEPIEDRVLEVEYFNKGQLGFGQPSVEVELGRISIVGEAKAHEDWADRYSGFIHIERRAPVDLDLGVWLRDCDAMAMRITRVLSIAHGALLSWGIRKVFLDGKLLVATVRPRGPVERTRVAVWPHLNLQPVLEVAVRNYSVAVSRDTGFEVALSWFLSSSALAESKFVQMMIALEHLVHVCASDDPSSQVVGTTKFRRLVRPAIEAALHELVERTEPDDAITLEQATELVERIGGINHHSFQKNLERMLDRYKVACEDLRGKLREVINERNAVIHRGLFRSGREDGGHLERCENLAEELLVRIFLTLLDYRGRYNSPLYNLDWRQLPRAD